LNLLAQAVPSTIFGFAVGFFAFFGLPVFSLGFAMIFSFARKPTLVGTVSLAPKATPTNAKHDITPSALELKRQQNGYASGLANNRKMG